MSTNRCSLKCSAWTLQEFPQGTEFSKHKLVTLKSRGEKLIQFFQKLTKHSETVTLASYQPYATLAENLHESFVTQFRDIQWKRPWITFLVDPFNAETDFLKVALVTDEAELETIVLREEDHLRNLDSTL